MDHFSAAIDKGSLTDLVIVIDPGHGYRGGVPSGSNRTYNGVTYYEDDMTWNMALGARKYFQDNYPATQVIFVHDTIADDDDWNCDGTVNYTDRHVLANNLQSQCVVNKLGYTPKKPKADLFLSFHMNTNDNTSFRGTLCYRSTLGTASNWAAKSAELCGENFILKATDDVFLVRNYTVQTWTTSKYFDSLNMPQAVIEAGFLSNQTDALWFADANNAKLYGQYAAYGAMDYWYKKCGTTC